MCSLNSNFFRSAKKAMEAMFDWHWLPVGAMATPTLRKKVKPLLQARAARRGSLQASGMTLKRRDIEYQEDVERSEDDASVDDRSSITYEETE